MNSSTVFLCHFQPDFPPPSGKKFFSLFRPFNTYNILLVGTKGEGPFEVRDEQLGPEEIAAIQRELATAEIEQKIPSVVE